jgi:hypothetical protein
MVELVRNTPPRTRLSMSSFDLRTPAIARPYWCSVQTRRCLIVHEDNLTAGFGADCSDRARCILRPMRRSSGRLRCAPSPHSPPLLDAVVLRRAHRPGDLTIASVEEQRTKSMTATIEIRAPSEQTDGTRSQVQRWLKSVGDSVAENEPLIELETDNTIEILTLAAGVLASSQQEQDEIKSRAARPY